jgi:hypothetical protein
MPERTPNSDAMVPPFFRLFEPDDELRKEVMRGARSIRVQAKRARRRGVRMEFDPGTRVTTVVARLSDGRVYYEGRHPLEFWPPKRLRKLKDSLLRDLAREEGEHLKLAD